MYEHLELPHASIRPDLWETRPQWRRCRDRGRGHSACVVRRAACVVRHVSCVLRQVSCVVRRESRVVCRVPVQIDGQWTGLHEARFTSACILRLPSHCSVSVNGLRCASCVVSLCVGATSLRPDLHWMSHDLRSCDRCVASDNAALLTCAHTFYVMLPA